MTKFWQLIDRGNDLTIFRVKGVMDEDEWWSLQDMHLHDQTHFTIFIDETAEPHRTSLDFLSRTAREYERYWKHQDALVVHAANVPETQMKNRAFGRMIFGKCPISQYVTFNEEEQVTRFLMRRFEESIRNAL